jgi:hypothetical protein
VRSFYFVGGFDVVVPAFFLLLVDDDLSLGFTGLIGLIFVAAVFFLILGFVCFFGGFWLCG